MPRWMSASSNHDITQMSDTKSMEILSEPTNGFIFETILFDIANNLNICKYVRKLNINESHGLWMYVHFVPGLKAQIEHKYNEWKSRPELQTFLYYYTDWLHRSTAEFLFLGLLDISSFIIYCKILWAKFQEDLAKMGHRYFLRPRFVGDVLNFLGPLVRFPFTQYSRHRCIIPNCGFFHVLFGSQQSNKIKSDRFDSLYFQVQFSYKKRTIFFINWKNEKNL